jgi:uncharacterized lipoprotein YmbA
MTAFGYPFAMFLLAAIISGCGRTPQTNFYTLTPTVTKITAPIAAKAPTFTIAAVTLPEIIDRPQLIMPDNGSKVHMLETHRWAEPLKSAIPRILSDNLARLIGPDRISFYPQYASGRADYRIFLDIQQFEALKGEVVVDAIWTIKPAEKSTSVTGRSRQVVPLKGEAYETIVAAYSEALGSIAREIAATAASVQ